VTNTVSSTVPELRLQSTRPSSLIPVPVGLYL